MKQLLFFALLGFFIRVATAQGQEILPCGSDYMDQFRPSSVLRTSGTNGMRTMESLCRLSTDTIEIPIVVHVIEDTGTTSVCSDQKVQGSIDGMNSRFSGILTGNGLFIPMKFVLAKSDPFGNPTTGIDHYDASALTEYNNNGFVYSSNTGNQILNATRWDPTKCANIWVFNRIDGYAGLTAPITWGLAAGIFMNSTYFSQSGTTLTHEMGHFFGLAHVFEGSTTTVCAPNTDPYNQGDYVWDTPPVLVGYCSNYVTCDNSASALNSLRNFLGNECPGNPRDRFTPGQRDRMLDFLVAYGQSLMTSSMLLPPNVATEVQLASITNSSVVYSCDTFVPQIEITNLGTNPLNSFTAQFYAHGLLLGTTTFSNLSLLRNSGNTFFMNGIPMSLIGFGKQGTQVVISQINGGNDYWDGNNTLCDSIDFRKGSYNLNVWVDHGTSQGSNTYACGDTAHVIITLNPGFVLSAVVSVTGDTITTTQLDFKIPIMGDRNLRAFSHEIATFTSVNTSKIGKVFPNPAHNTVQLELHARMNDFTIQIINLLGSVVFQQEYSGSTQNGQLNLNVQSLAPGNYFLRLQDDEGFSVQKLVIQ